MGFWVNVLLGKYCGVLEGVGIGSDRVSLCVRNVIGVVERVEKASLEVGSFGYFCFMYGELYGVVIYFVVFFIY